MNKSAQQVFRKYVQHSKISFMCDNYHHTRFIHCSNCTTMSEMLMLGVDAEDDRKDAAVDAVVGGVTLAGSKNISMNVCNLCSFCL